MKMNSKIAPLSLALAFGLSVTAPVSAEEALRYATPEGAVDAVIDALHDRSVEDLLAIFGDGSEDVLLTGEAPRDRAAAAEFLRKYDAGNFINIVYDEIAVLFVGEDNWAFPIPLSRGDDGLWAFDILEGGEEIRTRRVGRNELDVIDILRGYVAAQAEYRAEDRDGDGVMEFAASVLSTPGTRDGLYWADGDSPLGDFIAQAVADGYAIDGEDHDPVPYAGYYYRVLTSQGEDAPGGAMDYSVNGNLVAGHGMLAVPASYGDTGVMSFMVSENGVVMQADLGEDTLEKAVSIHSYDPSESWTPAN